MKVVSTFICETCYIQESICSKLESEFSKPKPSLYFVGTRYEAISAGWTEHRYEHAPRGLIPYYWLCPKHSAIINKNQ